MATVSKRFRDDFEIWAADRLARGEFSESEMAEFKDMLRRDLVPGSDQIREGITIFIAAGVEVPATIDHHEERYRLWSNYFAMEATAIRAINHHKEQQP